jgi:hypothetical protein
MAKKARAKARVNTGLNWFFQAFEPGILERPARQRREKERKAAMAKTRASSTNPKRVARLKKRRKYKEGKLEIKQLKKK